MIFRVNFQRGVDMINMRKLCQMTFLCYFLLLASIAHGWQEQRKHGQPPTRNKKSVEQMQTLTPSSRIPVSQEYEWRRTPQYGQRPKKKGRLVEVHEPTIKPPVASSDVAEPQ